MAGSEMPARYLTLASADLSQEPRTPLAVVAPALGCPGFLRHGRGHESA